MNQERPGMGLEVIQVLILHDLQHNNNDCLRLLSLQDLGRLSITSKTVADIIGNDTLVWKKFFEQAASAGRGTYNGRFKRGHFLSAGHTCITWNGELGLLACLSDPQDAVIANVGYKRAAGCLYGKSCIRAGCGQMSGMVNPMTMERICQACSNADQSTWLISKSKAKQAFLLNEKDCKQLPKAEYAEFTLGGKACTGCAMLIEDAKKAAFDKFGGADGLATEVRKRAAAASKRFLKSQGTYKPQKKRSKIERLSERPADDLLRVRYYGGLPIGTFYDTPGQSSRMAPTFECNCDGCGAKGTLADIVMHEKLEHGSSTNYYYTNPLEPTEKTPPPTNCPKFEGLTPIAQMPGATTDLIRLFKSASMKYSSANNEHEKRKICFVSFEKNDGVKVCIDFIKVEDVHTSLFDAYLDICFRTVSGQVPLKVMGLVFKASGGLGVEYASNEFHVGNFTALAAALGMDAVDPAQLLSMFLLLVLSRAEVVEYENNDHDDDEEDSREKLPIHCEMWDILSMD